MQKKPVKKKPRKPAPKAKRAGRKAALGHKPFAVLLECPFDNPAEPDPDRQTDLVEAALAVQLAIGLGLRPTIAHQIDPVQKVCEGGYQVQKGKEVITIVFEGPST